MAVEVAVMPTAHDAVSPVIYTQNAWPSQPLSPNVDPGQYAHSPVGSVASPHNIGSPLSHAGANSPLGVCSPTAVHSPHMQAHSPAMQAGSPLQCPLPLNVNVNVKQELSGVDYSNCNNLTHLLRGGPQDFTSVSFTNGLNCHLGPPAQREILDGELLSVPKLSSRWLVLFTRKIVTQYYNSNTRSTILLLANNGQESSALNGGYEL